jgi:hypothetical protein
VGAGFSAFPGFSGVFFFSGGGVAFLTGGSGSTAGGFSWIGGFSREIPAFRELFLTGDDFVEDGGVSFADMKDLADLEDSELSLVGGEA